MPRHATVSAVLVAVLAALPAVAAAPGVRDAATTESACLEAPERDAPQGEHWYYHYDQQKNRKCWHIGAAGPTSLSSVFVPFLRGVRNMFRKPMPPHEHLVAEPRIVQSDATRLLTIDDIARQPEFPEERAETRPVLFLNSDQRRALYDEYVKWEALQRNGPASAAAP